MIVLGARDQGSVAATIMGSVSRGVVETARYSVLVARGSAVSRVVLATDGSPPARLATTIVASWPLFAGLPSLVVGVAAASPRYSGVVLAAAERRTAYERAIASSTDRLAAVVDEAVEHVSTEGRKVESEIRVGDAGTEIVATAQEWAADFVAIGAYGEPLLRRLVLGSVARKVLDGARSSVLVARPESSAAEAT